MKTPTQLEIAHILTTNPKQLLAWDADVLQYTLNVRQWVDLVAQQEYEVLAHVLQHNGKWLGVVRQVVAHGAVAHQDITLMSTVPHLRPEIEQILAGANGPFYPEFLDAVQQHFIDRSPHLKISETLCEALKTRAQKKRLEQEVELQSEHKLSIGSRKL